MNDTGMNTAMKTMEEVITGSDMPLMACLVALNGEVMPSSNFACTASTTTIESSTTVPITKTRANSVRRLMENPAIIMKANVPISDTMILIKGIRVLRKSLRKISTMRITRMIASRSVSNTCAMDAYRKSLVLIIVTISIPLGASFLTCSRTASMSLLTWVAFEPAA